MGEGRPSSLHTLVNKTQLVTLFYHYVKESLHRYYYSNPHLLRIYMARERTHNWEVVLTRFLSAHKYDDLIDETEIRKLAYHWVDSKGVGNAINDMEVNLLCFSVGLSATKYGNTRSFYQ